MGGCQSWVSKWVSVLKEVSTIEMDKKAVTQEPLGCVDGNTEAELRLGQASLPTIPLSTRHTPLLSYIRPRSVCIIYCGSKSHPPVGLGALPEPQADSQAQKSQVQTGQSRN